MFVRRSIILRAILICWFFGLTFAVIGCVLGSRYFRPSAKSYLWPTLDVLFLLMFVVTYASIFVVLARRRFGLQLAHNSNQTQFIVTVTAILVSFLCLEAVPTLVFAFHELPTKSFDQVLLLVYKLNLLCDPLIYIFLQRRVRKLAADTFYRLYTCLLCKRIGRVYHLSQNFMEASLEDVVVVEIEHFKT